MSIKEYFSNVEAENQKKHIEAAHRFLANEQIKTKLTKSSDIISLSSIILDDGKFLTVEDIDSFKAAPDIIFTKISPKSVQISLAN